MSLENLEKSKKLPSLLYTFYIRSQAITSHPLSDPQFFFRIHFYLNKSLQNTVIKKTNMINYYSYTVELIQKRVNKMIDMDKLKQYKGLEFTVAGFTVNYCKLSVRSEGGGGGN